ncbi:phylloplanin-like [Bidens hawaiensis]|uniref:phylloplanin-like n=1 Tax=Bidens hawaiensis TaxID=980011 RepID=UPI00404AB206
MYQALDCMKASSLKSMAMKSALLVTLFVLVIVASQAEAQLPILGLLNVGGTIFCSANGNAITNATTPTPPFANALVQISCGGNVISSGLTNGSGVFSIVLSPLQFLLTNLLSSCNLVVASPLSSCNSSLSSTGNLQAPLQLAGTVIRGLLSIVNLIPGTFQLIGA